MRESVFKSLYMAPAAKVWEEGQRVGEWSLRGVVGGQDAAMASLITTGSQGSPQAPGSNFRGRDGGDVGSHRRLIPQLQEHPRPANRSAMTLRRPTNNSVSFTRPPPPETPLGFWSPQSRPPWFCQTRNDEGLW